MNNGQVIEKTDIRTSVRMHGDCYVAADVADYLGISRSAIRKHVSPKNYIEDRVVSDDNVRRRMMVLTEAGLQEAILFARTTAEKPAEIKTYLVENESEALQRGYKFTEEDVDAIVSGAKAVASQQTVDFVYNLDDIIMSLEDRRLLLEKEVETLTQKVTSLNQHYAYLQEKVEEIETVRYSYASSPYLTKSHGAKAVDDYWLDYSNEVSAYAD